MAIQIEGWMSRPAERPSPPKEHLALRFIPQSTRSHRLVSRKSQKEHLRLSSKQEGFGEKNLIRTVIW